MACRARQDYSLYVQQGYTYMYIHPSGLNGYVDLFSRVTCLSLHVQQGYMFIFACSAGLHVYLCMFSIRIYINEKFYMFSRVKFLYVLYIVHVQQDTSLTVIFVKGTRALMDNKP